MAPQATLLLVLLPLAALLSTSLAFPRRPSPRSRKPPPSGNRSRAPRPPASFLPSYSSSLIAVGSAGAGGAARGSPRFGRRRRADDAVGGAEEVAAHREYASQSELSSSSFPVLIHWRGEGLGPGRSYSAPFRHDEFRGAFCAAFVSAGERGGGDGAVTGGDWSSPPSPPPELIFEDALWCGDPSSSSVSAATDRDGADVLGGSSEEMDAVDVELYNGSMQYVSVVGGGGGHDCRESSASARTPVGVDPTDLDCVVKAAARCALVHAAYLVVAESPAQKNGAGDGLDALAPDAISNGGFDDMIQGRRNENATWAVRLKHYDGNGADGDEGNTVDYGADTAGGQGDPGKRTPTGGREQPRYGERTTRSLTRESAALQSLRPLLERFAGRVRLKGSDVKVVVIDGVRSWGRTASKGTSSSSLLTRRLTKGPKLALISPASRICRTTTPLGSLPAYLMVNVARIGPGMAVLDPYAGSCSTLLAAAAITGDSVRTVGIEAAHDGIVNRRDIRRDFTTRGLTPPAALVEGDCTDPAVRDEALGALEEEGVGGPFDVILADPPYGIREGWIGGAGGGGGAGGEDGGSGGPLTDLLAAIAHDRRRGRALLRKGGRLVAFVPVASGEDLEGDCMPSKKELDAAGLELGSCPRDQRLNAGLCRWLVSFICTKD